MQPETPQPASPQPATPQPATPQPATPQPASVGRRRKCDRVLPFFLLAALLLASGSSAGTSREDRIKAGFLYRFVFFVEWPDKDRDEKGSIDLCIAGESSLSGAFSEVEGQSIQGKPLVVTRLDGGTDPGSFRSCDVLFISDSLADGFEDILRSLAGQPVLSVGEVEGFAVAGGMINFITRANSVGFEINRDAAESVGIKLRANLLRVADRIVGSGNGR